MTQETFENLVRVQRRRMVRAMTTGNRKEQQEACAEIVKLENDVSAPTPLTISPAPAFSRFKRDRATFPPQPRQEHQPKMKTKMKTNSLQDLANSFVATDRAAIRRDVARLGSIADAADYCADIACEQPHWEALDSDEGRTALAVAIGAEIARSAE